MVGERVMKGRGGCGDKVNFNHEQAWKIVALQNIILWSTLPIIEITVNSQPKNILYVRGKDSPKLNIPNPAQLDSM